MVGSTWIVEVAPGGRWRKTSEANGGSISHSAILLINDAGASITRRHCRGGRTRSTIARMVAGAMPPFNPDGERLLESRRSVRIAFQLPPTDSAEEADSHTAGEPQGFLSRRPPSTGMSAPPRDTGVDHRRPRGRARHHRRHQGRGAGVHSDGSHSRRTRPSHRLPWAR